MANNPQQMPLRGIQNAPKFNGKTPAVLPHFLEDVDLLGTAAGINDAEKICYAMQYADLDEAKVWQTVDAAFAMNPVWSDFVDQVKELYLGCEGTNHFCHVDFHYMVQDYCKAPMQSQENLGEYRRRFVKISSHLVDTGKLSEMVYDIHPLWHQMRSI